MTFPQALIDRLRSNAHARNALILTLGTAAAQGIVVCAMPLLSRIYTPKDFGLLAIFLAVSNIVATAVTLRFETAILLPKNEIESRSLVLISIISTSIFGILAACASWLIPDHFKAETGLSSLGEWLVLSIFCGVASAFIATGSSWYNRQRAYIKISQLRFTQSVTCVFLGIALGLWGFNGGLMFAQIISSFIVAALVLVDLFKIQVNLEKHNLLSVIRQHSASPKFLLPASLLDVVTLQLPTLLIGIWFSSEAAGQFSMAWKILALPAALIGAAVGQVFLQRFSATWPDAQSSRRLLFQTWKMLALVGLFPTIIIAVYGQYLFSWILGEEWREAGDIARVISPMLFAILISSPTSGIFLVLKLQKLSLFFGASFLIYRTFCIYLGFLLQNISIGLAAWVFCELAAIAIYNSIALQKMKSS